MYHRYNSYHQVKNHQLTQQENERHNRLDVQKSSQNYLPKQEYIQRNPILLQNYDQNELESDKRQLKQAIYNQNETYGNQDLLWKSSQKTIEPIRNEMQKKRQLKEIPQNNRNPILDGEQKKQEKIRPESQKPWSNSNFFGQQDIQVLDKHREITQKCGQIQFENKNYDQKQQNFGIKKLNQDLNYAK